MITVSRTDNDLEYILLAIERAKLSVPEPDRPTPSPKVGAVLTKEGRVLGQMHRGEEAPGEHAEYGLLERKLAHEDVSGGTLYTTLEPCTKRDNPKVPCAERIVDRRIARVVIGMLDPNQDICGKGLRHLRSRGVRVDIFPSDNMSSVEDQNRQFIRYWETIARGTSTKVKSGNNLAINPRYPSDIAILDGSFELHSIVNRETIFIVVGDTVVSELLDRHTCATLRDQVDSLGKDVHFRRAIIVSSAAYKVSSYITDKSPTISVGSGAANDVSKEWLAQAKENGISSFPLGRGKGVMLPGERLRVVLYGKLAVETKEAVEHYIAAARGLTEFLELCWQK